MSTLSGAYSKPSSAKSSVPGALPVLRTLVRQVASSPWRARIVRAIALSSSSGSSKYWRLDRVQPASVRVRSRFSALSRSISLRRGATYRGVDGERIHGGSRALGVLLRVVDA
ncbi:hypothetical protein ABZ557_26185 [Streptomyces sp. NPDC019645]|uniref:hypothetical protein n=1 Tax=Streptomyces sp. NPDC019645 TaxID=3154786 RepID=UPI0033F034E3